MPNKKGFVLWFTGLSGSGKSTLARMVEEKLLERGVEERSTFVEACLECPLDKLVERDMKGLYRKAIAGEIENFTGVSDPYESPLKPEVVVPTGEEHEQQSCARILKTLEMLKLVPEITGDDYAAAEEAAVAAKLKDLGYLG